MPQLPTPAAGEGAPRRAAWERWEETRWRERGTGAVIPAALIREAQLGLKILKVEYGFLTGSSIRPIHNQQCNMNCMSSTAEMPRETPTWPRVLQVLLDKPCGKLRRKNYAMGRRAFFGAQ
jgi:hypothetical protein